MHFQKAAIQQWNAESLISCLVVWLTECHAVSLNDASSLSLLLMTDLMFILFSSLLAVHSTHSPQGPSTPKTSTEKTAYIFPILYSASYQKSLPFLPFPLLSSACFSMAFSSRFSFWEKKGSTVLCCLLIYCPLMYNSFIYYLQDRWNRTSLENTV